MPRILPAKPIAVQPTAIRWTFFILSASFALTFLLWPTGLEHTLAQYIYQPDARWAWWLRQYGSVPALLVTLAAVLFLLSPWRRHYPAGRQLAVVWLLTALFGAALLNQVFLNELIDRARPRDSVLAAASGGAAVLKGHSFPSGHAAVGFVFVAPFFLWWQQRRKTSALLALAVGLGAGTAIGLSRMVLGAHFLTDVLWAGTLCLLAAVWAPVLYRGQRDVPLWLTGGLLLLAGVSMVWFNSFRLTLSWQAPQAYKELYLDVEPCSGVLVIVADVPRPRATVKLRGYGAPLSNLILDNADNRLFLQRWHGLYRGLKCDGLTVTVPTGTKVYQTP